LKYPSQATWGQAARRTASVFMVILLLLAAAHAQTLTGTVKNGTNNKPGAGDEVVLMSLSQGMEETGKTTTDAKGNFSFKLDDASAPHLVRVTHQGVPYHRMAPPGTTSVEVEIYDVAKKVEGISVTADVMRLQAQGGELSGIRLFAVNNASSPARTQMNDHNFEFYLPDGAQIDQAMAMTAGGQPISSEAIPQKEKNRYAFAYPLRPGETQFQVSYHLPYSGSVTVDPKSLYDAQHFVVMLPKSMQFIAGPGAAFQSMQDPQQSDSVVEVASNATVGQPLGFKISGTGILSAKSEGEGNVRAAGGRESRPGGGLGPPIDAPDHVHARGVTGRCRRRGVSALLCRHELSKGVSCRLSPTRLSSLSRILPVPAGRTRRVAAARARACQARSTRRRPSGRSSDLPAARSPAVSIRHRHGLADQRAPAAECRCRACGDVDSPVGAD